MISKTLDSNLFSSLIYIFNHQQLEHFNLFFENNTNSYNNYNRNSFYLTESVDRQNRKVKKMVMIYN